LRIASALQPDTARALAFSTDPDMVIAAAQGKLASIPAIRRTKLVIELPQYMNTGILDSGNQRRTLLDHRPKSNRPYTD